ncbi:MAG: hypothetical protein DYG99_14210 [Bacteroidetes bacterium CHB5]|nr:hypothetical protein [Bacteroidetes bacterium CHB5]
MTITLKSLKSVTISSLFVLLVVLVSCTQSDYTRLVKQELNRGVRVDSLIFGINFGDTRDEFYGKCFDLNKQQLIDQGPRAATVQYLFTDSLVHEKPTPMRLLFIPAFDEKDKIKEMNLEFSYVGWSPWAEEYQSSKLIEKVPEILMNWYKGNPFVIARVDDKDVPVKLDGNRRFLIYVKDEQNVVVKIHDILHPAYKHSISK